MRRENGDTDDLDEYVSKQLENYYGQDLVRSVSVSSPPLPPRKLRRGFAFSVVMCTTVFLTGAAMLAGVLFTGGVGNADINDSAAELLPQSSSAAPSTPESAKTKSDRSSMRESSSHLLNVEKHDLRSEKTAEETTKQENLPKITSSEKSSTDSEKTVSKESSKQENSSDITSSEKSSPDSEKTVSKESSKQENSSDITSCEKSSTDSEKTVSEETSKQESLSEISRGEIPEDTHRERSYSLPELSEQPGYIIVSDPNNNSETNPYDTVTTGRKARAGVGVFLMLASLASAFALYNSYYDEENNNDRQRKNDRGASV